MPRYQLVDANGFQPSVPDMRGKPKADVRRQAEALGAIWNLPEPVAVRALLRVCQVEACPYTGNVTIDDDTVVLWPPKMLGEFRITRETLALEQGKQ